MVNVSMGKTLKAKKQRRSDTKLIQLDLLSRGIINSGYNWVTSALYKFSKSSLALGGIVHGPA